MKKIILLLALCQIQPYKILANGDEFRRSAHQFNQWLNFTGSEKLSSRIGFQTEMQIRRHDFVDPQQLLLRGGLDYYFSDYFSSTIGYAWVQTHPYGEMPVAHENIEHRAWEQVMFSNKFERWIINHRHRLEQRWIEKFIPSNGAITANGYNYYNRFRYRFLAQRVLFKDTFTDNSFFVVISDEVFINFGKNTHYNIFDQNRFFGGFGYRFKNNIALQTGYLNHLLLKSNGKEQEINHTFQVILSHNFLKFRK
jgi:hypothetical protein